METIVIPGLPTELSALITVAIGIVASFLVRPMTAIAKKLGRTEGPTTVAVSAALSGLIGVAITVYQATQGQLSWGGVFIAFIAFLKANGDFLSDKQAKKTVVVDAQSLPTVNDDALGRPATADDIGPSMEVKYGKPK